MQTDTETDASTEVPDIWPPKAHLALSFPVKPGDKALCGAKLMGIDLRNTPCKICSACLLAAENLMGPS